MVPPVTVTADDVIVPAISAFLAYSAPSLVTLNLLFIFKLPPVIAPKLDEIEDNVDTLI